MREGMTNTGVTGTYLFDMAILVVFSAMIMIAATRVLEKRLS
jgi:hypothetical protein